MSTCSHWFSLPAVLPAGQPGDVAELFRDPDGNLVNLFTPVTKKPSSRSVSRQRLKPAPGAEADPVLRATLPGTRPCAVHAEASLLKPQQLNVLLLTARRRRQLFDLVLEMHVTRMLDEMPFTPDDLPGYAGRLFDYLLDHPHQVRLATWNRLERSGNHPGPADLATTTGGKVTATKRAQADGKVSVSLQADDILAFTMALTTAWTPVFPMPQGDQTPRQLGKHREATIEAVRRLTCG